tara:strand:- start:51868 stop:52275 length:408 start_codon:yes stop_codon:yes gene_type:complete
MLKFLKRLFERKEIPHIQGPGSFDQEVVGEFAYQKNLKRLCGGYKEKCNRLRVVAVLEYEDDNPHDNKAIKVAIDGNTVGYLSRDDAREYRKRIKKTGNEGITISCDAQIVCGKRISFLNKTNFGVWLDLPINEL